MDSLWYYTIELFVSPENNAWTLNVMITCVAFIVFMFSNMQIRNSIWRMESGKGADYKVSIWSDIKQLFYK